MPLDGLDRRVSYAFLCSVPLLAGALVAVRPLRVSGIHQPIGLLHFAAICFATWKLGIRPARAGRAERKIIALAGALLLTPLAFAALLWVGLGPPWVATPAENRMRYLVLLADAVAVGTAFILLKEALSEAGERLYSSLGFAANISPAPRISYG